MKKLVWQGIGLLVLAGYVGTFAWQVWHHQSRDAVSTLDTAPWFLAGLFAWAIAGKPLTYARWLAFALVCAAWIALRLILTPSQERLSLVFHGACMVGLGSLVGVGVIAYGRWAAMAPSDRKMRTGIAMFAAFTAVAVAITALTIGILSDWRGMSLSNLGIIAVILYLPVMFSGWFIFQKLSAAKRGA